MAAHQAGDNACACATCTCGRHKKLCKPTPHVETHLENQTGNADFSNELEYRKNYMTYEGGPRERGKPQPQQLSVGGEFHGVTENQEKYVTHPVPNVYHHPKDKYNPNPAPFEGMTTQKTDYPVWPDVKPPQGRPKVAYVRSTAEFSGKTTNKHDYTDFGVQPRYVHPIPVYSKNEAKFEGVASHTLDYRKWEKYEKPAPRPKAQVIANQDDRDFYTTSSSSYVPHNNQRNLVKPEPHRIPQGNRFEGTSVAHDDYQSWTLPEKWVRPKQEYIPSPGPLESATNYRVAYTTKTAEKAQSMAPKHQAIESGRFEGVSTNKSDYQPILNVSKREDFRPRLKYEQIHDDRDFMSTTKKEHDSKPLPRCAVNDLIKNGKNLVNKEGHLFAQ